MNSYCTITQFLALYDRRTMLELSGNDNNRDGLLGNIQTLLDIQAAELDSYLSGRWSLPMTDPPMVLTKWVSITTAARLYARRSDAPAAVVADQKWAEEWIDDLLSGIVTLPGIDRSVSPTLTSSEFKDGRSRWDRVLGSYPSADGTSKGR